VEEGSDGVPRRNATSAARKDRIKSATRLALNRYPGDKKKKLYVHTYDRVDATCRLASRRDTDAEAAHAAARTRFRSNGRCVARALQLPLGFPRIPARRSLVRRCPPIRPSVRPSVRPFLFGLISVQLCGRKRRPSFLSLRFFFSLPSLYDIRRDFLSRSLMASVSFISHLIVDAIGSLAWKEARGQTILMKVRIYSRMLILATSRAAESCSLMSSLRGSEDISSLY